jgi:hypothetical protein
MVLPGAAYTVETPQQREKDNALPVGMG